MERTSPRPFAIDAGSGGFVGADVILAVLFGLEFGRGLPISRAASVVGRSAGGWATAFPRLTKLMNGPHLALIRGTAIDSQLAGEVYHSSVSMLIGFDQMSIRERWRVGQKLLQDYRACKSGGVEHPDGIFSSVAPRRWFTAGMANCLLDAHFYGIAGRKEDPKRGTPAERLVMCLGDGRIPQIPGTVSVQTDPVKLLMATTALDRFWPSVKFGDFHAIDSRGPDLFSNKVSSLDVAVLGAEREDREDLVVINIQPLAKDARVGKPLARTESHVRWTQMEHDAEKAKALFGVDTVNISPTKELYPRYRFAQERGLMTRKPKYLHAAMDHAINLVMHGPCARELDETFGVKCDNDAVMDAYHEQVIRPAVGVQKAMIESIREGVDKVRQLARHGGDVEEAGLDLEPVLVAAGQ
jgi:hypothetical protein